MTDDLLREASDPTTPGEQLQAIWMHDVHWVADELRLRLVPALMRNPSLPLHLLGERLRGWDVDAWRNPSVPLLLLREPLPVYQEAALRTLQHLGRKRSVLSRHGRLSGSLEAEVAEWAATTTSASAVDRMGKVEVRTFARHLAGLFGLPWPEGS